MNKKIPKWRVEENDYNHGDLFELIGTTTYSIYYKDIKKPLYVFKGETESELNQTGAYWETTSSRGVKSVEIDKDNTHAIVEYFSGEIKKIPLIEPTSK